MQEVKIHNTVMYLFTQYSMHRGKNMPHIRAVDMICATQYHNVIC